MLCLICEDRKKLDTVQFIIWKYISVKGRENHHCAFTSTIRGL